MSEFDGLGQALEDELMAYYAREGERVDGSTRMTVDTNSTLVDAGSPRS